MAIYYPDILENNNPSYPLLDATFLKGTAYPLASISTTGSIPADKRNVGMIVFDSGSGKFYGYKGSNVSNWATASNWIEFGSGSGGGGATDITALNNFTGSMYVTSSQLVNTMNENSPWSISGFRWDGALQTNFVMDQTRQLFHNVTSSVNNLTAATGSYLYSGSYSGATSALTLYSKDTNYILDLSGLAGGGGGGFPITASNQGNTLTENARSFNFAGNAVTATNIGSAVTVTINTGSATAVDITPLNNFTGSAQTSITALNTFSGSANTRLDNLEAATGSYVTNAKTGSFYYSSSINSNVITFNQGDGTTESVTIVTVPTASYAANIFNSDGALTGARVLTANGNNFTFNATSSVSNVRFNLTDSATFEISGSNRINLKGLSNTTRDTILGINTTTGQLTYFNTSSIQNVISASFAPNVYNSNGTLTGDRVITLGTNNQLRIAPGDGESEFRISDGPIGGPFSYEVAVSGSGEFRVSSLVSASFQTSVYIAPNYVLTLAPRHPLPSVGVPTGSFAVSSSIPPRPYMWDGASWYAL